MNFDKVPELQSSKSAVRRRRLRWIVFGTVVIIAAAAFGLHRSVQREEQRTEHKQRRAALREELRLAEVAAAEAARLGLPREERIRRLEHLLGLQRAIAQTSGAEMANRIASIRQTEDELNRFRLEDKLALSLVRENEALAAAATGEVEAATALWREAWQLQREVNRSGPRLRDLEREQRLEQEAGRTAAEPLQRELEEKLGLARRAVAAKEWDAARANFSEARVLQERLNREFPRSRFSDLAAIARIDSEIASLSADGLETSITAKREEGRQLAQAGRHVEAAAAFAEAVESQRELNERFGRSRFYSTERLEAIEVERQTALAAGSLQRAELLRAQIQRQLRRREMAQAQEAVREALGLLEEVKARLPKARGLDDSLRLQLGFLSVRAADLTELQDRIYGQLQPLPGRSDRALLRVELRQADFARVMTSNPSRNTGRVQPVDSVTFAEAVEFCRRVSWVVGWPVRLPTAEEMQTALDSGRFEELAGGLDEWLAPLGADVNLAPVFTATGTVLAAPRTERSRQRGFRILVEVDLSNPAGTD